MDEIYVDNGQSLQVLIVFQPVVVVVITKDAEKRARPFLS